MNKLRRCFLLSVAVLVWALQAQAASYYPVRLDDPKAVYLTPDSFPVRGDGVTDDSVAIQVAIDRAAEGGEGIVFVPSGRYRVTRTIYVWPAVRVIGYGKTRPMFVLADHTPGYEQGLGYMFLFAGGKPRPRSQSAPRIDFATGRPARPIVGTVPPD